MLPAWKLRGHAQEMRQRSQPARAWGYFTALRFGEARAVDTVEKEMKPWQK
jgi:hypothetical protein